MESSGKNTRVAYHTSLFERVSYGLNFFGQNIFYITVAMFLLPFFTDIGIPAAVVGIVTLVVKIWDAINDPIFGGVVDKVKFKSGKFLPWLRISLFIIPLATIFLFAASPNLNDVTKVVWVTIGYMLWDTAFTMCDVPIYGLVTTLTDNQTERVSIMSFGRTFGILGAVAGMVVIPSFRVSMGGWVPTVIWLSVVGIITMLPLCFVAKERFAPKAAEKEISFKEMFAYVGGNKYLLIFFGASAVKASFDISSVLSLYVGRFLLGSEKIIGLIALSVIVPALLMGFFGRILIKRFDKYNIFWASLLAILVINVVMYFVGYNNLMAYIVLSVARSFVGGVFTFLIFMFTPDCAEYGIYKTGIAATGTAFAFQSFTTKIGAALATSIGAFTLAAIKLVPGEGSAQLPGFEGRLWFAAQWIPAIGSILALIILRFYKLRDKDIDIMTQANYGKITHEEAEKLLSGRKF